jgi:hypothetical protein
MNYQDRQIRFETRGDGRLTCVNPRIVVAMNVSPGPTTLLITEDGAVGKGGIQFNVFLDRL